MFAITPELMKEIFMISFVCRVWPNVEPNRFLGKMEIKKLDTKIIPDFQLSNFNDFLGLRLRLL